VLKTSRSALFFLAFALFLRAQSTNASLTGRVTDPSHALIADARIAAVSDGTNVGYETATNSSGEYTLTNLAPGVYRIEVEKTGFKKLVKPDVILHVQDALAIDFEMTLGAVSDTVTVEAGAPLVNTESGTVSTVIDHTFVDNLPLNGRSFQTLIMLTPGVVVTVTSFQDQGQFSVNGQRADANYFTVDGVSANFGVTGDGAGRFGRASGAQRLGRDQQPCVGGRDAGVTNSDVFLRAGVRTNSGRTDLDSDPLGNERFSRHAVRILQE
jgi:hypothetical protein